MQDHPHEKGVDMPPFHVSLFWILAELMKQILPSLGQTLIAILAILLVPFVYVACMIAMGLTLIFSKDVRREFFRRY